MSFTRFCAANPIATPATPAEASKGPRLTPMAARNWRLSKVMMIASPVARTIPARVLTCGTRPPRAAWRSATLTTCTVTSLRTRLRIKATMARRINRGSLLRMNSWISAIHSSSSFPINRPSAKTPVRSANIRKLYIPITSSLIYSFRDRPVPNRFAARGHRQFVICLWILVLGQDGWAGAE